MSGGVPAGWVLVPVEQEDRELAATAQRALYPQHGEGAGQGTLDGIYDTSSLVQAFARRRLATPTPPIEGRDADVERVARAIDAADNDWIEYYPGSPFEARVTPKWSEAMARAALQALGERG